MPTQKIVSNPSTAAMFLVVTINKGAESEVADVLTDVSALTRAVSFRHPQDNLRCVVGVGSDAWDRMFPDAPRPKHLHPFEEIRGDKHVAVSTPGDLLFHLRASRMDLCFELAKHLLRALAPNVTVQDEVHGFRYFDSRDLLGFVDGTENPEGSAALRAALIGDEDPAYTGGSYVLVQKYTHQMAEWDALPVEEQERVIGRTKLDDIEMDDDTQPSNSHVALNDLDDDENGNPREIYRDNMPFGQVGTQEFGTYFIGYAADPQITEDMLENMFIGNPPGNYDRILDFSTAITGTLFFVPPLGVLDDPDLVVETSPQDQQADEVAADVDAVDYGAAGQPEDQSLRIGSLKKINKN